MQKGDWLLKDGQHNIFFNKRIPPSDTTYGATYSERAKGFGRWYRKELETVKELKETPTYFREQLTRCFTYKGPVLEWYCRIKTRLENNYEPFHQLLPRTGFFYDLGCGYGFMTYMLHWAAMGRQFIGVDYDEEKISTAQALHLKDDGITFREADLRTYSLKECDGIIISDVLHYLLPHESEALLRRCVDALKPNGILIVRDGVAELEKRQKRTAFTELISTQVAKFNKTTNELHFISQAVIERFAAKHGLELTIQDNAKFTSNLTFILRKA
jgi:SAM-dependent methyltransferase